MEHLVASAHGCLRVAVPEMVRSFIARWWLSESGSPATAAGVTALGEITLRPHQSSAVVRLAAAIAEFGGALLCDEVGTGKTFIALAVARRARSILVVAPASLHDMWHRAAEQAGVAVAFTSFERLSRRAGHRVDFDFLIVDEAHHARNASTARYGELSALAMKTPTLLLSATPIHNQPEDLSALMALFLGSRAGSLSEGELSRCVIRRDRGVIEDRDGMPRVEPAEWCHITHDDALPASLLALPPPLPPRNGGDGGVLIARSLIRQWASSDAALMGGLRRRLHKSIALIAGLESGVYPSDADLSAWAASEDSMQLAFPELVAPAIHSAAELLAVARAHSEAIQMIYHARDPAGARDQERAGVLRRLAERHEGVKIVAFSQYSDTVTGLFRALASRGQVAALTARGAMVAGGILSRGEALDRFAPRAGGVSPPRAADRISLLLTTDLLSEGVNLQDAGVVVHLDIPWTPARLEQRVGRIARLGSEHDRVWSYALKPPASAEALLRIEQIIEKKISIARAAVGGVCPVLPSSGVFGQHSPVSNPTGSFAAPVLGEAIRRALVSWMGNDRRSLTVEGGQRVTPPRMDVAPVTAVAATGDGFLAACVVEGQRVLLSSFEGRVTGDLHHVLDTLMQTAKAAVPISIPALRAALLTLHSHFRACDAMRGITPEAISVTRARRALLRRISGVAGRARPHLRGHTAAVAQRARSVVLCRYGVAAETALCRLASSQMDGEDWLRSIEAFGAAHSQAGVDRHPDAAEIVALILFQRGSGT